MPWEGTERTQAKENTAIFKIEGGKPKGIMEIRKHPCSRDQVGQRVFQSKKKEGQQLLRCSLEVPCCLEYGVLLPCGYLFLS